MRRLHHIVIILVLLASISQAVDYKKNKKSLDRCNYGFLEDYKIDIEDDGTLLIIPDFRPDVTIEITENYELFVNGDPVELDRSRQDLVRKYYDGFMHIIDEAKDIGLAGARIGVEGAAIGVSAVAGVFKLIRSDYDGEDLEEELEAKAEKLEERADRLEERADSLESYVDEFEELHKDFCRKIPEISQLELED